MAKWYLARAGGSPIGPLRPDALVRRIRGGTLSPETLVWSDGMREWVPVAKVPEFAREFSPEDVDIVTRRAPSPLAAAAEEERTRAVPLPVIPSSVLADLPPESTRAVIAPMRPLAPTVVAEIVDTAEDVSVAPPSSKDSWSTILVEHAPPSPAQPLPRPAIFEPARAARDLLGPARGGGAPVESRAPPTPVVVVNPVDVIEPVPSSDKPTRIFVPREDESADKASAFERVIGAGKPQYVEPPRTQRMRDDGTRVHPLVAPPPTPVPHTVAIPRQALLGPDPAPQPPTAQPQTAKPAATPRVPLQQPPAVPPPFATENTLRLSNAAARPIPGDGGTVVLPSPFQGVDQYGPPPQAGNPPPYIGSSQYGPPPAPRGGQPPPYPSYLPPPQPTGSPYLPVPQPAPMPTAVGHLPPNRSRLLVGAVFVVGLVVGIFVAQRFVALRRAEAERRAAQDREANRARQVLYVPCFASLLPELSSVSAGKDVPCAGGTLSLQVDATGSVSLALKGLPADAMASKLPDLVARVMPNLPMPAVSRTLPMRALRRLDLRGQPDADHQTFAAFKAYHDAELLVEGYEAMGGHRFARWTPTEGRIDAENYVEGSTAEVLVRFFPGQTAPSPLADAEEGHNGADVTWKSGPVSTRNDPDYLVDLRRTMLKQGWWFDDADAFMAAAVTAGPAPDKGTAAAVGAVAAWIRSSDSWSPANRFAIWNGCFPTRLNETPAGSRARYDEFAGVWKDAQVFVDRPEYKTPQEEVAVYARVYAASIGSPVHAFCTLESGRDILGRTQGDTPESHALIIAPLEARQLAQSLIGEPRFSAALGRELVKVRSALLKPGPPDL